MSGRPHMVQRRSYQKLTRTTLMSCLSSQSTKVVDTKDLQSWKVSQTSISNHISSSEVNFHQYSTRTISQSSGKSRMYTTISKIWTTSHAIPWIKTAITTLITQTTNIWPSCRVRTVKKYRLDMGTIWCKHYLNTRRKRRSEPSKRRRKMKNCRIELAWRNWT